MKRDFTRNITLGQILAYIDGQGDRQDSEMIEVVFNQDNWEDFVRLPACSPLLDHYVNCLIRCLGVEEGTLRVHVDESTNKGDGRA